MVVRGRFVFHYEGYLLMKNLVLMACLFAVLCAVGCSGDTKKPVSATYVTPTSTEVKNK